MKIITQFKNKIKLALIRADRTSRETLSRSILPSKVQSNIDKVIVDNDLLIRCCVVGIPDNQDLGGYPEKMNEFLIAELLNIEGEDFRLAISYGVNKIDNSKAINMFERADYDNRVDQDSYLDKKGGDTTKQPPHIKKLQSNSYKRNIEALFDNDENMFRTALIVVIKAQTEQGLRSAESRINAVLKGSRVFFEFPDSKHLETLLNSMMVPAIWKRTSCELFSYHAALLLPIQSPGNRLSSEGVLFGESIEDNPRSVQINMEALAAQHIFVCGASGTGKTYFLILLIMRSLTMEKKRVIYITPKADEGTNHLNVFEYFNGLIIELGRGKNRNINPFEIFIPENFSRANAENIFYDHVDILKNFFMALILSETAGRDNMISYLERTIHEVYEKKGIYLEDPTTWHNWPYLSDIYKIWEDEKDINPTAEALYNKASSIMTSWNYLNQPSNVDLSNDLICFDTSGMRSSTDKLQDAYNILLVAMMGMRFKGNKEKKTMIVVDEGRVFLQTPQIASFLMRTLMEGRSARIELVIAVQQPSDLAKANVAEEMKTNINVNVVLGGMNPNNVGLVSKFFNFDASTQEKLLKLGKGSGLVMIGGQIIATKFKSTDLEHRIIKGIGSGSDSNAETLATNNVLSYVSKEIENLSHQQKICFDDWLTCDPGLLRAQGFDSQKGIDCMTGKNIRVWLKQGERPENMTDDHFLTVCRLSGVIIQTGHKIKISHFDDADIIIDEDIAVEYERPGSHTFDEICKKRDSALEKYNDVVFVCQAQNYDLIKKAVGEERTVTRGKNLRDWIEKKLQT
jgi:hypothetical protein